MHLDDATAFLVDFLRNPRRDSGSSYGYDFYMPSVIVAYIIEIEKNTDHQSSLYNGPRAVELSPAFYEAAWNLCRRGILRPGIRKLGLQATDDGSSGNGYSVTSFGRAWLEGNESILLLSEPGRLGELFSKLSSRLGVGFLQRANEAARCHSSAAYLACCAMCGAAAESILLSVAVARFGDEATVLQRYLASQGRRKIVDSIVGNAPQSIASPFRSATGLLSYWRDEAAHGTASTISEVEAHEALARLLRFAQFTNDHWTELTLPKAT